MATHSSTLAWRIPWMEEPGGLYSPWDRKEMDMAKRLQFLPISSLFEGPLLCHLVLLR